MVLPNEEIHKQSVKNYNDESELQFANIQNQKYTSER